ncbi:hypothetical protein WA1_24705 [Scytonema hofmannii PCC 7110]|uniref:Filamentous haemagglutinin FhaB/tRNA nuclease CdiA-like TPS domain-containing protein n=1 Tax=Scytonema hofmannii PCC 7110 TaxID=128403 RepID=A0A139X821_9CYAN|nr:S-layer family protein [Scytonema hofmannii]KYC40826.1 hypothetical protein WA1_24705 [Scytonema hofmannii PCC 7110]
MNINWQRSLLKPWLTVSLFTGCLLTLTEFKCVAQITPDSTLGTSVIQQSPNIDRIEGGAVRGVSLFHSFQEFNVGEGRRVEFAPLDGIENIFSRVTGSNASNIDGTLKVLGNANLFLLNPNGILFGPNAKLDIPGSFVASTASSLLFKDGVEFSATNPEGLPLLKISLPIGLQFGSNPRGIEMQNVNLLDVEPGVTRALVGGNVTLDGSDLRARGGRVELGGLAEAGTVNLVNKDGNFSFSFPLGVKRSDVLLKNGSMVNVRYKKGGDIAINARDFSLTQGSQLKAGIGETGTASSLAGDIKINATGTITLADAKSFISNAVEKNGLVGQGGNIDIQGGELSVTNGAQIYAGTFGEGNVGNINIEIEGKALFADISNERVSGVFNGVESGGIGQGGNIHIIAKTLEAREGGRLETYTFGEGNAGNINIQTLIISFQGEGVSGSKLVPTAVYSEVGNTGIGKAGNITIETDTLSLKKGARLESTSSGNGDTGSITIIANNSVSFDSVSPSGEAITEESQKTDKFASGAFSRVERNESNKYDTRKSGNISISTRKLFVTNGAVLTTSSFGKQGAGNIHINSKEVTVTGESPAAFPSGIYSRILEGGAGQGGSIVIDVDNLYVTYGGTLETSSLGNGDAGSIIINARDTVSFEDISPRGKVNPIQTDKYSSGAFSRVERNESNKVDTRKSGNISINTRKLSVTNGAVLTTSTFGRQKAGNIDIKATDEVKITGEGANTFSSGVYSRILEGASGSAGDIEVETGKLYIADDALILASSLGNGTGGNIEIITSKDLSIRNGAKISVESEGTGSAGNIKVNAASISLIKQGAINATTESTDGGNISLKVRDVLFMRSGSRISTTAGTANAGGNGGRINISTPIILSIPLENSDISADAFSGQGGKVEITAEKIFWMEPLSRDELLQRLGSYPLKPERLSANDITAISQQNPSLNGVLAINSLDIDLNRGLTPLPSSFDDPSNRIDTSCYSTATSNSKTPSQFINTGRGGLPPSPSDPLNDDTTITRLATINNQFANRSTQANLPKQNNNQPKNIVEVQGWTKLPNGRIKFVSQTSTATPQQNWQSSSGCYVR